MNHTEPKFMTVDEFAKAIGVHPQTLRNWDKNNILLPHHKMPSGRRQYTQEQVADYFNNQK